MAKRKYRSVNFKSVDWAQVENRFCEGPVVFAVDVAKEVFFGLLHGADKEDWVLLKWRHPVETRPLLDALVGSFGPERLQVVMEPSGVYGDVLRWQLEQRGVAVYRVSPKQVHDSAEVFDGVPSLHDAKATWLISELHGMGRSARWRWESETRRDARARLTAAEQAQARYQRAYNQLEGLLARHWPEITDELGLQAVALHALLERYGSPQRVAAAGPEAAQWLQTVSRSRLSVDRCERIVRCAAETQGVPCTRSECTLLASLAQELRESRHARAEAERAISAHVEADEGLERLAKVIGPMTAMVLRCALGDPRDYPNAQSFLKSAGLNLREHSSGTHQGRLRLTKRGPGVVRRYLYWAVLRWIKLDPRARQWFDAKSRRDGGRGGRAITALMRRLAKGLWAMSVSGERFDSERLFAA